jgi:ribosomal protein S12 methylthiotransferase
VVARKRSKKKTRKQRAKEAAGLQEFPEGEQPVVGMISLGCAKNTVDSERVLGMLAERGFAISADPEWADIVVVNTCAFIAPARKETEKVLRDIARTKPVVAIGCYPQRMRPEGKDGVYQISKLRDVAAFVSFEDFEKLPDICAEILSARFEGDAADACFDDAPRLRTGSTASAYLKIAEGCDNRCCYCTLPDIRGPLTSKPLEDLIAEAHSLVALGAREVCVIAQDTGRYGTDIYGESRTPELLRGLCAVDGLEWVRLLYVHPRHLSDEIIEVLATEPKMCRYLDLPIQHSVGRILKAMGRGYDTDFLRKLVARLRSDVPDIALRSTAILGFPGESDEDVAQFIEFMREIRFDHLGAFEYSKERGTPAAELPDHIPHRIAVERRKRVMEAQQEIAFEVLDARVGSVEGALLEYGGPEYDSDFIARTRRESPEVDGRIYVEANDTAALGDIVEVEILQRSEYDLICRIV